MLQFLEDLRKLRLAKVQEVKEMKLKLENLKTHKDAAQKLRQAVAYGQDKRKEIGAQIADFEHQISEKQQVISAIDAKLEQMAGMAERVAQVRFMVIDASYQ